MMVMLHDNAVRIWVREHKPTCFAGWVALFAILVVLL